MRLQKLLKRSPDTQHVLQQVLAFPHWYIQTEEQKKLNKKTLEEIYAKSKRGC